MPPDANGPIDLVTFLEQEVLPRVDRATVLADLKPVDKGAYWQLDCPQCRQPRAYIYKDGVVLKCNRLNTCGFSSSLIAYLNGGTPQRGRAFVEAVRRLADLAGVPFPDRALSRQEVIRARRVEVRAAILTFVRGYAQRGLWSRRGGAARRYLQRVRGLSRREIRALGFGLYPSVAMLRRRLRAAGYSETEIESAGVLWE